MLIQIRERASGIVAYIIVILIAIPFAFWGIQEYFSGPSDQNVAVVDGTEITKRVYDNQLQEQKRYLKSILGNSYNALYKDEDQLKQSVLDNLILNTLLNEETQDAGYRISNGQLFERIKSVSQFQNNGQFDQNRYEQFLATQRRTIVEFEEQLRQEERVNQYQSSIVFSSFLPGEDKTKLAGLKNQKRNFEYFVIDANDEMLEVSESEIAAYYEANALTFETPARVKLEYIEIKQDQIADSIEYSEEELLALYEDEPERYRTAELRDARHILFKLKENAGDDEIEEVFANANEVMDRINAGEEFAALASEFSEDKVSSANGGRLGFLSRTDIDNPEFVDKLFSMEVGQVSGPVRTKLGVQIVKLEEINPSKQKSFEEVRTQVANALKSEAAEQEFVKQAELLQELSYESEDSLDSAAEALGMTVQTSDWISSAGGAGIGEHTKVVTAAFSNDVLVQGFNSELLELAEGQVAVIRVLEHEEAETRPIGEVSESIVAILKHKNRMEASFKLGEKLVDELKVSPDRLKEVVADNQFTLETPGALLRDDDSVPGEILAYAFKMPVPANGQPVLDGFQTKDGKYVVVRLNQLEEMEEPAAKLEATEWISLQGKYGRREMSAMVKALRELRDVEIFPDQL